MSGESFLLLEGPDFQIVERSTGAVVITLYNAWMARQALRFANEFGPNKEVWKGGRMGRKLNGLTYRVACAQCGASEGKPCKRPSEHPLMYGTVHTVRRNAFDRWLVTQ